MAHPLFTAEHEMLRRSIRAFVDGAKSSGNLSKPAVRAADAALVLLAKKETAAA